MHTTCNWRAGASQPSRSTGTMFLCTCIIHICIRAFGRCCTYRNVLRRWSHMRKTRRRILSCAPCAPQFSGLVLDKTTLSAHIWLTALSDSVVAVVHPWIRNAPYQTYSLHWTMGLARQQTTCSALLLQHYISLLVLSQLHHLYAVH